MRTVFIYVSRMPNYRRATAAGGTFFFTVNTNLRRRILVSTPVREALRHAVRDVQKRWPFTIDAWVLLPDHLHCVWTLPDGDDEYAKRWSVIKRLVTRTAGVVGNTHSREARREGGLWQRRFWEHQIRDEEDFRRHVDYVYWNPVKHGLVAWVSDWPYSTFHRDVRRGLYPADWGQEPVDSDGSFGEP